MFQTTNQFSYMFESVLLTLVVEHNISTSSILQLELVMLQYVEMIILFLFTL